MATTWLTEVRAATAGTNLTLKGVQTIDGVALAPLDPVLVKDQTTASENGTYTVHSGPWIRRDTSITPEATVRVSEGTSNAHTEWYLATRGTITVGTTALTFLPAQPPQLGQHVAYVATVLGPLRTGILAVANAIQVGSMVVFAECCVTYGDGGGGMFRWDAAGGTDDGGTIIVPAGSGIGSTGPCWRRIYDGAVNVRWFGAQGNGIAGDTFALQQALNFLMATPNGGKLYIPTGIYKITYTLTLVGDYWSALTKLEGMNDSLLS